MVSSANVAVSIHDRCDWLSFPCKVANNESHIASVRKVHALVPSFSGRVSSSRYPVVMTGCSKIIAFAISRAEFWLKPSDVMSKDASGSLIFTTGTSSSTDGRKSGSNVQHLENNSSATG